MLRLSRQAWNNVLIFSMLIMIALLNGLHKKLGADEPLSEVLLLPEHSLVLIVNFGEFSVERIGQSWRINQSTVAHNQQTKVDAQALASLMDTWKQYVVTLAVSDDEALLLIKGKMPDYYVVVTLAGKDDGAVYTFYPQLDDVIVHDQFHGRFVTMPISDLALLFPTSLPFN